MKKTLKSWAANASRRGVTRRAASDVERGLKNTDCRTSGAEAECPRPARRRRLRK